MRGEVIEIDLGIGVLQVLGPDDVGLYAAATQDLSLYADMTLGYDNDLNVTTGADMTRCLGLGERIGVVRRDPSRSSLRGRVCDDLKKAGDEPIVVGGVIGFR